MDPCGQQPLTELIESESIIDTNNSHIQAFEVASIIPQNKRKGEPSEIAPQYVHKWTCSEAVTTVAYYDRYLYVGTVTGLLITYDLHTYQEVNQQCAHTGSILTMICQAGLLFTGSSDSLVKVWIPGPEPEFQHTLYMLTDIGDIFSMAYNAQDSILYIGTQNASIHWVRLDEEALEAQHITGVNKMPAVRPSKFFDSKGPGGKLAPQQERKFSSTDDHVEADAEKLVEVPLHNQIAFAHHSSVFSMVVDLPRNRLITGSGDGFVKLWKLSPHTGRPVEIHSLHVGDSVLSMALASSWQLCCGLDQNSIIIVDLETLQLMKHEISIVDGPLLALAAVEDGIFVSSNSSIVAYDATTAELCTWRTQGFVTSVTILPPNVSSGQLVTTSSDGSVVLWNVELYNDTETDKSLTYSELSQGDSSVQLRYRHLKIEPLSNDNMISFLANIVKYQTVSGRDRLHWSDSRKCATAIRDQMRLMGGAADLLRVEDGNPIVFAEFKATKRCNNGKQPKRVLFYGHYDVIEAKKDDLKWNTPPFTLVANNGYIHGRGVTDDKGPCVAALYAVAKLSAEKLLGADVVFLIEGEEESGSFGFMETIAKNKQKIGDIDWIIFSNSLWLDDDRPCLNYGLRGVIFLEIELTSGKGDVHSGVDGGLFREPSKDMINLLAKLTTDQEGKIAVPGFFDSVMPVTEYENKLYEDIVANTSTSRDDIMHKWRYPSLTVHKFEFSGPHNQTVIPANVKAYISLRLVPSQTAEEINRKIREYLNSEFSKFNSTNKLDIRVRYEADPWLGDPENRLFTLMRNAVEDVWQIPPLFIREGGTIPVTRALEKMFDAPAAQLPCGQSSDGAHLNNERMRLTNIFNARKVFEQVLSEICDR